MTDEQILDKLTLLRMVRFASFRALAITIWNGHEFDHNLCKFVGLHDDDNNYNRIRILAGKMYRSLGDDVHIVGSHNMWSHEARWLEEHSYEEGKTP